VFGEVETSTPDFLHVDVGGSPDPHTAPTEGLPLRTVNLRKPVALRPTVAGVGRSGDRPTSGFTL